MSGITHDTKTGDTYIVFGGKILIHCDYLKENKGTFLSFSELEKKERTGQKLEVGSFNEITPRTYLIFEDTSHIDAIVKALLFLKEKMILKNNTKEKNE